MDRRGGGAGKSYVLSYSLIKRMPYFVVGDKLKQWNFPIYMELFKSKL